MDLTLAEKIAEKYWKKLSKLPNVVGYSSKLRKKIAKGRKLNVYSFVVYVTKKEPLKALKAEERIPLYLDNIPTDVIEIGEIKSLILLPSEVDKTSRLRPVPLGVSISNWNVSAGTLGMLYTDGYQVFAGSNAHIVTDRPEKEKVRDKRIVQPGTYHAGRNENNVVGEHAWHKVIVPYGSTCKLAKAVVSFLNFIAKLFGRRGRFYYREFNVNYIDFGIYKPNVEHVVETADESLCDEPIIGHLFAGSSVIGVICKIQYIIGEGFTPMFKEATVKIGDKVKGCSFWCNYSTTVRDDSAGVLVNYGSFKAFFKDVIFIRNDGTIKGGWSGTGFRLIED